MYPVVEKSFEYIFGQKRYTLSARTHIMGILNVTPDSFSDGGRYRNTEEAVHQALQMVAEGADFVDVGGESTRPRGNAYGTGAKRVDAQEELRRVIPVIEALAARTDVPISIDTYKSEVAAEAIRAGASIVNDISGFTFDEGMAALVGNAGVSAILMHIKGTPETMQLDPHYDDLFAEVITFLSDGIERATAAGVSQIIIDPGLGFGKSVGHNFELLRGLDRLTELGCPVLVGPSRKSFIGAALDLPVDQRLEGTLAACVGSILSGAHILRVHDVREAKRAALVADAIKGAASIKSK